MNEQTEAPEGTMHAQGPSWEEAAELRQDAGLCSCGDFTLSTVVNPPLPGSEVQTQELALSVSKHFLFPVPQTAKARQLGAFFPSDLSLLSLGGQPECGHLPSIREGASQGFGADKGSGSAR